ncbi:hypothetical protein [Aliarcobacter skirrowii]|uniref:Uncharacterized protein n=3 Tax=Aliarcobacter skirrowii TaxID=28200 RepID=A0AAD0SM31_9BACT|nr:hypothetical protein [Aliarcobacter skirrowii]AXX84618.1 hypothetical protein ASKIR_0797 [Aliarcobacter skirrowii CCUG 10374]RXI24680.1 hypothetical protein CP959_09970 [Aliarcobacter skirrowii CCUG 10374]SUV14785.1 Uncharacterised protein [Aliarcobacter skirrowii]
MSYFFINQIKEINAYPFTISSMIDKFYVDEDTNKAFKELNEYFKDIIDIFSSDEEFEAIIKSSNSASKLEANRVEFDKILKNIRPITFINTKKDEELKKFIEKDTIYSQILNRDSKNSSDSYLNDYENLDLLNTKQSFIQDGKTFDSFIKSKYLYFKNSSFYKNISKDEDTPEEIIKVIHNKLKSEELKNILEAYKNIKNTNLQEYIVFSKNTLYMLCAPRLNIDEESIFNNIFHKDLSNIFDFYTSMRKKMGSLENDAKADLIVQYRISALFFNMISKSYTFAILQPKESEFHTNAKAFIPYDEKTEEEKKSYENRFHFINEPKFTKQILEKVKEVELISKAVEDILDEIIKEGKNRDLQNSVDKYLKSLRTFSSTIAFLRIIDFTLMDNKNFKDFSQFANDVLSLTIFKKQLQKIKNVIYKSKHD